MSREEYDQLPPTVIITESMTYDGPTLPDGTPDMPSHDRRACLFAAALWGIFCAATLLAYAFALWIAGLL